MQGSSICLSGDTSLIQILSRLCCKTLWVPLALCDRCDGQVVGMIRPMTGDFEFFDPIPLQVKVSESLSLRLFESKFRSLLPKATSAAGC